MPEFCLLEKQGTIIRLATVCNAKVVPADHNVPCQGGFQSGKVSGGAALWKGMGLFGEIYKGMDRAEDGDCLREVGGKHQRCSDRAGQSRHGPAEREPSQPERPLRPLYFAIFIITMAPGRLWGYEKFLHRNSLEIFLTYSFGGGPLSDRASIQMMFFQWIVNVCSHFPGLLLTGAAGKSHLS